MKGAQSFRKILNRAFRRTPSTTTEAIDLEAEEQLEDVLPDKPKAKVKFRRSKDPLSASGGSIRSAGTISEHLASLVSSPRSIRKQSSTRNATKPVRPIKRTTPQTILSDLPNELIQAICEEISSDEDLYSFGFSCRRFCECALGVYRAKNGIVGQYWGFMEDMMPSVPEEASPTPHSIPSTSTKARTRFIYDLQPQVALEGSYNAAGKAVIGPSSDYHSHIGPPPPPPSHIPELFCIFHFPESNLIWEVMGFMSLLAHVFRIGKVTIQFHGLYVMDDAESLLDKKAFHMMNLWTTHLIRDVLQVVLQKKGCAELVFEVPQKDQAKLDRPIYRLHDLVTPKTGVKAEREWVLDSPAQYRRHPIRARTRPNTPKSPNGWALALQSFTISSSTLLFQEPFLMFTMQTLNHHHSSLHELRLHALNLPPPKWKTFFARISIPTLRSLILVSCNVPFTDLSSFLERHEDLEMLKVETFDVIGEPKTPTSPTGSPPPSTVRSKRGSKEVSSMSRPSSRHAQKDTLLPKLTTLIAPLDYVIRLLTPSSSLGTPLPRLSSLTIIASASFDSDLRHEEHVLSPLSARLLSLPSITLRIYLLRVYEGDPPINLLRLYQERGTYLQLYPNLTSLELVGTFLPSSFYYTSNSWTWRSGYGFGSKVRVRSPNAELDIPIWLSHFKNVNSVLISEFAYVSGGWRWGMQSVMEKVKTLCPWIESVYVEAKE